MPEQQHIARPLLWLAIISFLMYLPTIWMGETDLDDGIAINTFHNINEDPGNLALSFTHTIFNTQADQYYRPVAQDAIILNYELADHGTNIALFHLINILLHLIAVLLLYKLLLKLNIPQRHSFILAGIFAVHPVLTEAVGWICARVETLLGIFVFAFFINVIDYGTSRRTKHLLLSALFLLLALLTKETAVACAPVAFVLLMTTGSQEKKGNKNLLQYVVWVVCYTIWWSARSYVLASHSAVSTSGMVGDLIHRLPLIIQYIGKIFLPFNLSVFPSQEDTVYWYGIAGTILLAALLLTSRQRDGRKLLAGAAIFILFLLPVLIIPANLSVETYEYRLYVPMAGMLIILSQTALFRNGWNEKRMLLSGGAVAILLAAINYNYQRCFNDPLAFWTNAATTSPHSSYANMMLSARIGDPERSKELFLKAFSLNQNERYVNFLYADMLQGKDSVQESERYLLKEKRITGYDRCDLLLARVALERKDSAGAMNYLETYLSKEQTDTIANNNLLVLYLDTDHDDKAKAQAKKMKQMGLPVPPAVLTHFNL